MIPCSLSKAIPPRRWKEPCCGLGPCANSWARRPSSSRYWCDWRRFIITRESYRRRGSWLTQSIQDPGLGAVAPAVFGCTVALRGELTSAGAHLEQAIAVYDPRQHTRPAVGTADLRVDCLAYAALTLWALGYPDQGL